MLFVFYFSIDLFSNWNPFHSSYVQQLEVLK